MIKPHTHVAAMVERMVGVVAVAGLITEPQIIRQADPVVHTVAMGVAAEISAAGRRGKMERMGLTQCKQL